MTAQSPRATWDELVEAVSLLFEDRTDERARSCVRDALDVHLERWRRPAAADDDLDDLDEPTEDDDADV